MKHPNLKVRTRKANTEKLCLQRRSFALAGSVLIASTIALAGIRTGTGGDDLLIGTPHADELHGLASSDETHGDAVPDGKCTLNSIAPPTLNEKGGVQQTSAPRCGSEGAPSAASRCRDKQEP